MFLHPHSIKSSGQVYSVFRFPYSEPRSFGCLHSEVERIDQAPKQKSAFAASVDVDASSDCDASGDCDCGRGYISYSRNVANVYLRSSSERGSTA